MLLVWDKRVYERINSAIGQFFVNVLQKVWMILFGHVQECMVLMMIVIRVLCGRSSQGCTLGGIRHGV